MAERDKKTNDIDRYIEAIVNEVDCLKVGDEITVFALYEGHNHPLVEIATRNSAHKEDLDFEQKIEAVCDFTHSRIRELGKVETEARYKIDTDRDGRRFMHLSFRRICGQ